MAGLRVGVVAGEASGDRLAAGLVAAIRALRPDAEFRGIAGPRMTAEGVEPVFATGELSVLGLVEVLGRLPRLLRVRREFIADMRRWQPDVFVGVDAPDFNLPVARRLRAAGFRTVQYVSPTVWAWRPGRVKGIARSVHAVLCMFPFEPPMYAGTGTDAVFVGHPLADQLQPQDDEARGAARHDFELDPERPVIAVLPGSRTGEMRSLAPVFAGAVSILAERPGAALQFVAPMVDDELAEQFARVCEQYAPGVPVKLLRTDSRRVIAACDVVLGKSGTASLEALLLDRPLVAGYRVAPLTAWILRTFGLLKIQAFAMPNVLAGRNIVPEFVQEAAEPAALAAAVGTLLDDPAASEAQRAAFAELRDVLKAGDSASAEAARAVVEVANR